MTWQVFRQFCHSSSFLLMSSKALPEIIIYNNVYIVQSDKQANKIIIIFGDFYEVGSEVIWMVIMALGTCKTEDITRHHFWLLHGTKVTTPEHGIGLLIYFTK